MKIKDCQAVSLIRAVEHIKGISIGPVSQLVEKLESPGQVVIPFLTKSQAQPGSQSAHGVNAFSSIDGTEDSTHNEESHDQNDDHFWMHSFDLSANNASETQYSNWLEKGQMNPNVRISHHGFMLW